MIRENKTYTDAIFFYVSFVSFVERVFQLKIYLKTHKERGKISRNTLKSFLFKKEKK